jgi:Flp pilus assembly protein TadG
VQRKINASGSARLRHGRRPRHGVAIVFLAVVFVVLVAFCSLAVDLGRVQLVKTELRRAADAAARYGITGLPRGITVAQDWAIAAAAENRADGTPVVIDRTLDIEFGTWNPVTRSFTVLSGTARSGATALRVTAPRTRARGTGVSLMFAGALGVTSHDLSPSATVTMAQAQYGVVGLDYIKMGGNSSTSYWSSSGTVTPGNWGNIASNGNITLSGSTFVQGNARPGPTGTVSGAAGRVTGITTPLPAAMSYPPSRPDPYGPGNHDNGLLPTAIKSASDLLVKSGEAHTVPGGNYYFQNVHIAGTLTFSGPATIYCYGSFSLTGHAVTQANLPKNLKIVMVRDNGGNPPAGGVSVGGTAALYATIYAPEAPVTLSGTGDIYGSVLGKSIDMTGTSAIRYDLSLTGTGGAVTMVK